MDSAIRAKGEVRRYCRANDVTHLGTLTFGAAVYDYLTVALAVEAFLRRMREDGWHLPMVLVPEPHPKGHGWHVHFGTDRYLPIARLRRWWQQGIVDIRSRKETRRIKGGPRGIASYLAKYVTKGLVDGELYGCQSRPAGAHRYWRTEGFDPAEETRYFATREEAEEWLKTVMGGEPDVTRDFGGDDPARPAGVWMSWPDRRRRPSRSP